MDRILRTPATIYFPIFLLSYSLSYSLQESLLLLFCSPATLCYFLTTLTTLPLHHHKHYELKRSKNFERLETFYYFEPPLIILKKPVNGDELHLLMLCYLQTLSRAEEPVGGVRGTSQWN